MGEPLRQQVVVAGRRFHTGGSRETSRAARRGPQRGRELGAAPRCGAERERERDDCELDGERDAVARVQEIAEPLEMAEREAAPGQHEEERSRRCMPGEHSSSPCGDRHDHAAEPCAERRDVCRREEERQRPRETRDPVRRVGVDESDGCAERRDRPQRARRALADGAGQSPEAERCSEPQARDVPVTRQQHVIGEPRIEGSRRRERGSLAEQSYRLGDDHRRHPDRDEAPQPRRHPT